MNEFIVILLILGAIYTVIQWICIIVDLLTDNTYECKCDFFMAFIPGFPLLRAIHKQVQRIGERERKAKRDAEYYGRQRNQNRD